MLLTYAMPLVLACAIGAWLVAVWSAVSVVRLAPRGQKLRAYFNLGWWQFAKVRAAIGPAAEPHIRRFRRAFYAFFAVIATIFLAVAGLVALS
ncbi:MAG: hypothetical protein U1F47_08715 [Hyphomicrobiales bacterium]